MLCMKSGVRLHDREALKAIPTPEGEGRWLPVPHFDLANAAVERAKACGLTVKREEWGLAGEDNQRLYGVIEFAPQSKIKIPAGLAPCMALRSSLDKSIAIGVAIGATVFCCQNGVLRGDYTIRKLHTTGFDLDAEMDIAFQKFQSQVGDLTKMVTQLQERRLGPQAADHMIMQAFVKEVLPWSFVPDVVQEYQKPQHEEFKPRNAWSLYNAFTEVAKRRSPGDQMRTLRALNQYLVAEKN